MTHFKGLLILACGSCIKAIALMQEPHFQPDTVQHQFPSVALNFKALTQSGLYFQSLNFQQRDSKSGWFNSCREGLLD